MYLAYLKKGFGTGFLWLTDMHHV